MVWIVAQIDQKGVVTDGDLDVEHTAVVLLFRQFKGAFGQFGQLAPCQRFAMIKKGHHGIFKGRHTVFGRQFAQSPRPDPHRGDGRPDITFQHIWHSGIDLDDLKHRPDRHAFRDDLDGWQAQTLLEDLGRMARKRSGRHAPHVGIMRNIGGPSDQSPVCKDRHGHDNIVQVGDPAKIGVVRGKDIPRFDIVRLDELGDNHLDRLVQYPNERRNPRP